MDSGHRESTPTECVLGCSPFEPDVEIRVKQYKSKLKEWGVEKNINETDMRAIVRKDLKRKAEDPFRPTVIRLRKRLVPKEKIERYRRDHDTVEETIMSDAGTPITNARSFVAHDNPLNVATPSDISCETPVPIAADEHESPLQVEHHPIDLHDAHMQSTRPPITSDLACEALTAVAVNFSEEVITRMSTPRPPPASTIESDIQALNLDEVSVSMLPDKNSNYSLDKNHYASFVKSLQPLITQLRKHSLLGLVVGPNDSISDFFRLSFVECIQVLRLSDNTPEILNHPSVSLGFRSYASSSSSSPRSSWLISRLELIYTDMFIRTAREVLCSHAGLVPLFAEMRNFLYSFDIESPKIWSCIDLKRLWPFFRRMRATSSYDYFRVSLERRGCCCFMCEKLPTLMDFYNAIEACKLYALAETVGYTVDHIYLEYFLERTKFSLQDFDAIDKLHERDATSMGVHWVSEPVNTDSDYSRLPLATDPLPSSL